MKHLVIVGPMGAGKTTVGRAVATQLGRAFVDTDDLVLSAAGATVAEIFERDGEAEFRRLEADAVRQAVDSVSDSVISCGGGAVLDDANRRALREHGFVVWLDAEGDVLARRVDGGEDHNVRPLLANGDRIATLERIRTERSGDYEAVSDIRIDTKDLDVDAVSAAVTAAFEAATS